MRLIYEFVEGGIHPPTKVHPTDAGWDLPSRIGLTVVPGQVVTIPTGLAVRLDVEWPILGISWYPRIAPRSGLARAGILVSGGVIDPEYRGEIKVVAVNLGPIAWEIKPGDRVAQLLPEVVWDCREAVEGPVGESERGGKGFGSSGR